jgi:Domain of unknown function (DUF4389)
MEGTQPPEPAAPSAGAVSDYPVTFAVDYPDRQLNRLSTAFRIFAAIPILIVIASLAGSIERIAAPAHGWAVLATLTTGLFIPTLLMILFRQKYPRWWFDWQLQLFRFNSRIGIYLSLMDDQYPSTDEQQSVHVDFPYPDAKVDLDRGMPLVKWLLAIPHYCVIFFLSIGAVFAVIGAWFAILFTGRYPRGLFGYVEGVFRWSARVSGYAVLLVTDKYPPFRLAP